MTSRIRRSKYERTDDAARDLVAYATEILGEEQSHDVTFWLSSGCLLLDLAINRGVPGGKLIEVYGREGTGKTALALSFIRSAQKLGGTGILLDVEGGLSTSLAKDIVGVSLAEGWIYRVPETAEQCLDAIEVLADRAVDAPTPTVIVLDSVAALCAASESFGRSSLSKDARVTGKGAALMSWFGARGILRRIQGSHVVLVFVNQIRDVLDFYHRHHAPRYTTPGGHAVAFYSSVRLEVTQTDLEEEDGRVLGAMVRVVVSKNKVGPPFRSARFPFYFHPSAPVKGIDDVMSQLAYLLARGAIQQKGSWYTLGPHRAQGKLALREKVLADPEACQLLRDTVVRVWLEEQGLG